MMVQGHRNESGDATDQKVIKIGVEKKLALCYNKNINELGEI